MEVLHYHILIKNQKYINDRVINIFSNQKKTPIFQYSRFIINELLQKSGPLIDDKILAARLGVDINSSKDWNNLLKKLNNTKYSGVYSDVWKRWWFIILSAVSLIVIGYTWIRRRFHEKIEKARILNELIAAHDTQMGLMPGSDPTIEGFDISGICIPAEEVGGDFYDIIKITNSRVKFNTFFYGNYT